MMRRGLFFFFLLLLVACSQNSATISATATALPMQTLPPRVIPYTPTHESLPPDTDYNIALYILIDNSYSSINFNEIKQIAAFFFTLSEKLQTNPKVYKFGGRNRKLEPLSGYNEIMNIKPDSSLGDFYADALTQVWEPLSKEMKKRRVLIVITEGSFYDSSEAKLLEKNVKELVSKLSENDRLYFLVDADSSKWWKENLEPLEHTDVLEGSGAQLGQSIKKIGEEIFGSSIKWLFAGESGPITQTSSRQQLCAVLLYENDSLRVILDGGGIEPLYGEQNFRYKTYDRDMPPKSLELLSSYSGIAAYWTKEFNTFSISALSLDRKKCSSSNLKCLELTLKLSSDSDMRSYVPNLELLGVEKKIRSQEINFIGGNEYTLQWRLELENEPEKIFFLVEDANGKIVFGRTPIVPFPLIMDVTINDSTYKINFWFISELKPEIEKIFTNTPQGSDCESESTVPEKGKEAKNGSFWEYENKDYEQKNTIKIWLRNPEICNIQGIQITFQIDSNILEFKCYSDQKICSEVLKPAQKGR